MTWELLSPLTIALAAVILVALERALPYAPGQALFRRGFFTDFFWYTLAQSYVLGLVIAQVIRALDRGTGLSRLHVVSGWPVLGHSRSSGSRTISTSTGFTAPSTAIA